MRSTKAIPFEREDLNPQSLGTFKLPRKTFHLQLHNTAFTAFNLFLTDHPINT